MFSNQSQSLECLSVINAKNKMNPEQDDIGKSKFTPFLTAEKIQGVNRGLRDFPDNLPFPPRRLFRTPHQIFLVKIWPGWVGVKSESFFKSILIVLKYIRPCYCAVLFTIATGSTRAEEDCCYFSCFPFSMQWHPPPRHPPHQSPCPPPCQPLRPSPCLPPECCSCSLFFTIHIHGNPCTSTILAKPMLLEKKTSATLKHI